MCLTLNDLLFQIDRAPLHPCKYLNLHWWLPFIEEETIMRDHPSAASVEVSVGAKNPQKPSRKPFTFGLPNEMRLIDIYKHIRNPPAEDHIDAIKELREFVDQHQDTINELKLKKASFPPSGRLKPSDQKELDKLEKKITEEK